MAKKVVRVVLGRGRGYRVSKPMVMDVSGKIYLPAETIYVKNYKGVEEVGGVKGVYTDDDISSVEKAVALLRKTK